MATISLKTVYQTLHDLAELGEITSLDVGTGRTRFDPNVDHPHHHLVCRGAAASGTWWSPSPVRIPKGAELGSRWARQRWSSAGCAPRAVREDPTRPAAPFRDRNPAHPTQPKIDGPHPKKQ